jgi:hypothetical protein
MACSALRRRAWLVTVAMIPLAAGLPAARAQTYSVEIRPVLNGLDIGIEHVAQASMLIVKLTNRTDDRVRCQLVFDASPQTPVRSTRSIRPGRTISSVLRAQRRWFSVIVDVTCQPSPG